MRTAEIKRTTAETDISLRLVLEGTGIGTAYERLDVSFHLKDGVTVYIYERTRDITAEEYRAISDELTALSAATASPCCPWTKP